MNDTLNLGWGRQRLPMLLQSEAAECALACLAMVACYHGARTDLAAMRARFSVALTGSTMAHMVAYADQLQLTARVVRLEVEELAQLQTPCVLHWEMNHFVVMRRADARGIVIHDPALGVRRLSYKEIGPLFTGYAMEFGQAPEFKQGDTRRRVTLAGLIGKSQGLWQALWCVFAVALCLEVLALVAPLFQQWVVDDALTAGDRSLLNQLVLGFVLLVVTQTVLELGRKWSMLYLTTRLNLQWGANVFRHMVRLPIAWYEKRHLGDVVSRFGAVTSIQNILTGGFITAALDGLMAVCTLIMMLVYSPMLTAVIVGAVLLYALVRALTYRPQRDASAEELALAANAQSCFLESVRAAQAIKLFGREVDRRHRWQNLTVDAANGNVRTQKLQMWISTANVAVGRLTRVLILWLGASLVLDAKFTVGMLFAFTAYGTEFLARAASLIDNIIAFRMLSVHTDRLAEIVYEPPEPEQTQPQEGASIAHLEPRLELVDVGFRYSDADRWVLRHVNLVIEPGDSVAIIGPSGGGKSTLVKLILGMLTPQEGEIRYGGVPLQQLGIREYRAVLASVMQNDQLLAGSLADNISFFDQPRDMERVVHCAKLAALDSDIATMPMRYETLTGDMGTTLSGGQKQRVLLARALYKRPKVLVLDEATSHLDVMLERQVNSAVAALNMTRIVVAHRPETITRARRVIALINGTVEKDVLVQVQQP
jgi:ATP-binding cassette subfamily B protein RaxB